MDLDFSNIWAQLMISCIGMALFMYGKKAQKMWPLMAGIAMSIYPFFFSSWIPLWGITIGILVALYLLRDK